MYNKLNQSPTADPNVNYNMLHDVIKLAKDKHMLYKTVKFNKYTHNKSTWITLAVLKYFRYRDKLRNKLLLLLLLLPILCRAASSAALSHTGGFRVGGGVHDSYTFQC